MHGVCYLVSADHDPTERTADPAHEAILGGTTERKEVPEDGSPEALA
jgi:hypothetical protein